MLDLCDAHGIERPEVNVVVDEYEVDFLWRRAASSSRPTACNGTARRRRSNEIAGATSG